MAYLIDKPFFIEQFFTLLIIQAPECKSWRVTLVANLLALVALGADKVLGVLYHDDIHC